VKDPDDRECFLQTGKMLFDVLIKHGIFQDILVLRSVYCTDGLTLIRLAWYQ